VPVKLVKTAKNGSFCYHAVWKKINKDQNESGNANKTPIFF
jgi:hypothetical protein